MTLQLRVNIQNTQITHATQLKKKKLSFERKVFDQTFFKGSIQIANGNNQQSTIGIEKSFT